MTDNALVDALQGRAAFYDLLAALYFKPLQEEQLDHIAALDETAYADMNDLFAEGLHDMVRSLAKRNTGTRQTLAVDFTAAFAGTSSWKGKYAVPYESVFTSDEGLLYQESYHEVYHLFRQNQVERSAGYDFPDDHLSFMCEFVAILSRRAIEALQQNNTAEALGQIRLSREFMQVHMLSWFDSFEELAVQILKTRFYRGVLKVTKGYFLFDVDMTADLIAELEQN